MGPRRRRGKTASQSSESRQAALQTASDGCMPPALCAAEEGREIHRRQLGELGGIHNPEARVGIEASHIETIGLALRKHRPRQGSRAVKPGNSGQRYAEDARRDDVPCDHSFTLTRRERRSQSNPDLAWTEPRANQTAIEHLGGLDEHP